MDILKRKFLLTALAIIFCYKISRTSAQNTTITIKPLTYHVPIIPIVNTNILGPKKFERIIVPTYPNNDSPKNYTNEKKKFVSEKREKEPDEKKVKPKINSKNYSDGKGNLHKSYSYVNRDDNRVKVPTKTTPNDIQPLHIATRGYKTRQPESAIESAHEKKKKTKEQQEKLKIENLPDNPLLVPETNWWDNSAKYNYGIIHDDYKGIHLNSPQIVEKQTSNEHARKVETKEAVTPAVIIEPVTQVIQLHEPSLSPVKFKSSFKDPSMQPQVHHRVDNPGRFLYKTQVYYPNYRDHLYLPVTTYYGNQQGLTKVFPVLNSQTVYHNTPTSVAPPAHHHQQNHHSIPHKPQRHSTPPTVDSKRIHPTVIPPQKKDPPQKPSEKPLPSPPSKEEAEVDYDYDDEEGDDEEEGEGDGSSDKYQGESGEEEGSEEDDDEEEEKPKYRYEEFRNNDSDESTEGANQFDLAWKKYGYGPKTKNSEEEEDEDSYESSESQIVPERRKIVHMKMEYYSTPRKDTEELVAAESNVEKTVTVNDPKKETEAVDVDKKKKRKENKKKQDQHPNAGPDDLKFFQYLSYLGNGEHRAGSRSGNDKHYIEQHERGNHKTGQFKKKIVWADKKGGYGQQYYDLNHGG